MSDPDLDSDPGPDGPDGAPKKPLWKRAWFIVTAIIVAILLVAGITTAATQVATIDAQTAGTTQTPTPTPPPLALETPSETATPVPTPSLIAPTTTEPTPEPTAGPTAEPSPEPTGEPITAPTIEPSPEPTTDPPAVDPARFKTSAGKHLNDFEKGLNAMSTAMTEFNNPLVVANSVKLALNAKQLKGLDAPENISEEWNAANDALTSLVAEMKVVVKAQDYPALTNLVEAGHHQVAAMRDIVARAE
ncbi:hypothetical protein [Leifsonia sp. NPDC058248]|uniref:hypothetical protein n=1 Tax=Leifsonia sp. NPDC058248 TaxID=3346402 RepID=UPI0036D95FCB